MFNFRRHAKQAPKEDFSLTADEQEQLQNVIIDELRTPPTIGIIGVSGVGKSSTINTLFKTSLPVSHTSACTRQFEASKVSVTLNQGRAQGQRTCLRIYDAPGLGEDCRQDPSYLEMYQKYLPECDVILWVMAARNRAVALDQFYLKELMSFHSKIVFGLNQVDLVDPLNWKDGLPIPSKDQNANISEIVSDRSKRLSDILGSKIKLIPYSNSRGYNLEELFAAMIGHVQGDRGWIFAALKNFDFRQFLPESSASQRDN